MERTYDVLRGVWCLFSAVNNEHILTEYCQNSEETFNNFGMSKFTHLPYMYEYKRKGGGEMKKIIKASSIFLLFIMVVSCATTPHAIPEKYNLDNEFEAVDQIYAPSISSWQQVDIQSVIIRANVSDYYLLVLRRPMDTRIMPLSIGVSSSVSNITPGYDRIFVEDTMGLQYYYIDRIYKLKGKEQVKEIKERLRES